MTTEAMVSDALALLAERRTDWFVPLAREIAADLSGWCIDDAEDAEALSYALEGCIAAKVYDLADDLIDRRRGTGRAALRNAIYAMVNQWLASGPKRGE